MTSTPMSPREIAARLSTSQRQLLLDLPTYAVESFAPRKWLVFKGLAHQPEGEHRLQATPLGLQVRSILQEEARDAR